MKPKPSSRTLCVIPLVLLVGFDLFGIESFEIGVGNTYRQPGNTYFIADSYLLEMSYSAGIQWNKTFSTEIAFYSHGSDLMYYYKDNGLSIADWSGPYYRTEAAAEGYDTNSGNAQMHIFDIRFGIHRVVSPLDLFAEIGPTVLIPGKIVKSSHDLDAEPPDGWYETLEEYAAETGGNLPILGANCGLGFMVHLWYFTIWGAARYRYTWGIPVTDLLNNFELSFGSGLELYSKKR